MFTKYIARAALFQACLLLAKSSVYAEGESTIALLVHGRFSLQSDMDVNHAFALQTDLLLAGVLLRLLMFRPGTSFIVRMLGLMEEAVKGL